MLPADAIVRAAARWLQLLRASTLAQASAVIGANASYTDLTKTQYSSGLDLLRKLELLTSGKQGLELPAAILELPEEQLNQLLL